MAEGGSAYGAVYSSGTPPPFTTPQAYRATPAGPASISADGSTVAWMGENIVEQARMLSAETISARYTEPLWRRIDDGEGAPTRRVTGGSDPLNPACEAHPEARLPLTRRLRIPARARSSPNWGTWKARRRRADFAPRLSADGYTVAFMAGAEPVALAADSGAGPRR